MTPTSLWRVTAPDTPGRYDRTIFMAGGITDCPRWQDEYVEIFDHLADVVTMDLGRWKLVDPRQKKFDVTDPTATMKQISWETEQLARAEAVSFWFPKDSICPIALYELGAWSMSGKPIFVGIEDGYERTDDVLIQTAIIRPEVVTVRSLRGLVGQVATYINQWQR